MFKTFISLSLFDSQRLLLKNVKTSEIKKTLFETSYKHAHVHTKKGTHSRGSKK